jgi:superoxide dismutase, Cu-Zn family
MRGLPVWFAAALLAGPGLGTAADMTVEMNKITADGIGPAIGTVRLSVSSSGLELTTQLRDLPPGDHGFHLHAKGECGPGEAEGKMAAGIAAGGHWDPEQRGTHAGPDGPGHLGDLPVLHVADDGTAETALTAKRITDSHPLLGKALIIHAGGDNYSDQPKALGGGGARIACGVIR